VAISLTLPGYAVALKIHCIASVTTQEFLQRLGIYFSHWLKLTYLLRQTKWYLNSVQLSVRKHLISEKSLFRLNIRYKKPFFRQPWCYNIRHNEENVSIITYFFLPSPHSPNFSLQPSTRAFFFIYLFVYVFLPPSLLLYLNSMHTFQFN
jgi:hypothetical protein